MADLFGEMELAQSAGISGHLGAAGGVNLSGLPNVGGHGTPGMRSGRQRLAVNNLHRGKPNPFQGPQVAADPPQGYAQVQQGSQGYGYAQQPQRQDWMNAAAREHFGNQQASLKQTNDAIGREMDSRASQAQEWDRMQHEQNMAAMKYQSEMAGHQASLAANQQNNQYRQAKNSALMKAAGLGGTTMVNGRRTDAFGPLRQSLLG
jgi:hypothetical protein